MPAVLNLKHVKTRNFSQILLLLLSNSGKKYNFEQEATEQDSQPGGEGQEELQLQK